MMRWSLAAALVLLMPAAACGEGAQESVAADDLALLGAPLPEGARDVRVDQQAGIDRLVLVRFDAPAAQAERFAQTVLGTAPEPGRDPGLGYLGAGRDWWPETPPQGARGGERTDPAGERAVKLLMVPTESGARVWVAAFTM